MKKFLEKYPLFLLLLPLFIVLHIAKEYHDLINYQFVVNEIIFLFAAPLICFPLAYLFTRSLPKAGLSSLLVLIVFYFFGEVKEALKFYFPQSLWQSYTLLLPLAFALLVAGLIMVRKSRSKFPGTFLFVNILLIIFILADLVAVLWPSGNNNHQNSELSRACDTCEKPDIFYIVFDAYTSSRTLKSHFNFDNSANDSMLAEKGFRIIKNSRSNYNLTPFSIGSVLQADYIANVDTARMFTMRGYLPGVRRVYDCGLVPGLHKSGYTIYNHSIFNFRSFPSTVPAYDMWNMFSLYEKYNLVKKMDRDIGWHFPNLPRITQQSPEETYAYKRDIHDSITLSHLMQTIGTSREKPKFVYAHFLVPHDPYTFDSTGNKIPLKPLITKESEMQAYVSQTGYVNRVMTTIVDSIFNARKRPFIIILQGDHGYRFVNTGKTMLEFDNLNAFYFYNGDYRFLHDSLTNINTFPVIYNTFFGKDLPMRPDRFYFLKHR